MEQRVLHSQRWARLEEDLEGDGDGAAGREGRRGESKTTSRLESSNVNGMMEMMTRRRIVKEEGGDGDQGDKRRDSCSTLGEAENVLQARLSKL